MGAPQESSYDLMISTTSTTNMWEVPDVIMDEDLLDVLISKMNQGLISEQELLLNLVRNYEALIPMCKLIASWLTDVRILTSTRPPVKTTEHTYSEESQTRLEEGDNRMIEAFCLLLERRFDPDRLRSFMEQQHAEPGKLSSGWQPPAFYWELMKTSQTAQTLKSLCRKDRRSEFLLAFNQDLLLMETQKKRDWKVTKDAELSRISGNFTIFSHSLAEVISDFLLEDDNSELGRVDTNHISRLLCHTEPAYFYSQAVLNYIPKWRPDYRGCRRLSEVIYRYMREVREDPNVADLGLLFSSIGNYPELYAALSNVQRSGDLNGQALPQMDICALSDQITKVLSIFNRYQTLLYTKKKKGKNKGKGMISSELEGMDMGITKMSDTKTNMNETESTVVTSHKPAQNTNHYLYSPRNLDYRHDTDDQILPVLPGDVLEETFDELQEQRLGPFSPIDSPLAPPLQRQSPQCEVLSEGAISPPGTIEPFSPTTTTYYDERIGFFADSPAIDTPIATSGEAITLLPTQPLQLAQQKIIGFEDLIMMSDSNHVSLEDQLKYARLGRTTERSSKILEEEGKVLSVRDQIEDVNKVIQEVPITPLKLETQNKPIEDVSVAPASQLGDGTAWTEEYDRLREAPEAPPMDILRNGVLIDALLRDFTSPAVLLNDVSLPKYVELILALTTLSPYEILARETELRDIPSLPADTSKWVHLPKTDIARILPGHWTTHWSHSESDGSEGILDDEESGDLNFYDDYKGDELPLDDSERTVSGVENSDQFRQYNQHQYIGSGKGINSYYAHQHSVFPTPAESEISRMTTDQASKEHQSDVASSIGESEAPPSDVESIDIAASESGAESSLTTSSVQNEQSMKREPMVGRRRTYEEPNGDGSWAGTDWLPRGEEAVWLPTGGEAQLCFEEQLGPYGIRTQQAQPMINTQTGYPTYYLPKTEELIPGDANILAYQQLQQVPQQWISSEGSQNHQFNQATATSFDPYATHWQPQPPQSYYFNNDMATDQQYPMATPTPLWPSEKRVPLSPSSVPPRSLTQPASDPPRTTQFVPALVPKSPSEVPMQPSDAASHFGQKRVLPYAQRVGKHPCPSSPIPRPEDWDNSSGSPSILVSDASFENRSEDLLPSLITHDDDGDGSSSPKDDDEPDEWIEHMDNTEWRDHFDNAYWEGRFDDAEWNEKDDLASETTTIADRVKEMGSTVETTVYKDIHTGGRLGLIERKDERQNLALLRKTFRVLSRNIESYKSYARAELFEIYANVRNPLMSNNTSKLASILPLTNSSIGASSVLAFIEHRILLPEDTDYDGDPLLFATPVVLTSMMIICQRHLKKRSDVLALLHRCFVKSHQHFSQPLVMSSIGILSSDLETAGDPENIAMSSQARLQQAKQNVFALLMWLLGSGFYSGVFSFIQVHMSHVDRSLLRRYLECIFEYCRPPFSVEFVFSVLKLLTELVVVQKVLDFRDDKNEKLRLSIETALGNFLRAWAPSQPPSEIGMSVTSLQQRISRLRTSQDHRYMVVPS